MRTPTKAGIAGVALATAGALMLAPSASGTHQSASSAFGVSAGGQAGMPMAQYPEGPREAGGQLPDQLGPLASGGALTVTAGNDQATAELTDLSLGGVVPQLPPEVTDAIGQLTPLCTTFTQVGEGGADAALLALNQGINQIPGLGDLAELPDGAAATEFCNGVLGVEGPNLADIGSLQTQCQGDTGGVTLSGVSVLGQEQPALAGPVPTENYSLLPPELDAVAKVTLNRHTQQGDVLTVDGLVLEVGGEEVAVIASATCGAPIVHSPPATQPQPQPQPQPEPRPRPRRHRSSATCRSPADQQALSHQLTDPPPPACLGTAGPCCVRPGSGGTRPVAAELVRGSTSLSGFANHDNVGSTRLTG